MTPYRPGSLARRLSRFTVLSPAERAFVAGLEDCPSPRRRGDMLVPCGEGGSTLMVMGTGWARVRGRTPDYHPILRFRLPGEIIGHSSIGLNTALRDISLRTDGGVCTFPRAEWFWISAWVILLGAELNSEVEAQTRRDTATGPDAPMGERAAVKADHLGKASV